MTAVFIHRHIDILELTLHLIWLITDFRHSGVSFGKHITTAFPLVATAQHSHLHLVAEHVYEILHMWGLSRPAYGDVTHSNDWDVEGSAFQDAEFEHLVAQPYSPAVNPAKRQQPFIYLYKIAFHSLTNNEEWGMKCH